MSSSTLCSSGNHISNYWDSWGRGLSWVYVLLELDELIIANKRTDNVRYGSVTSTVGLLASQ